jgi:hypothetical protein
MVYIASLCGDIFWTASILSALGERSLIQWNLSKLNGHGTNFCVPGADPGFQVRGGGGHFKKLRRVEVGVKFFGVFCVKKNHDFMPKNHIFPILGGPPPSWIHPCVQNRQVFDLCRLNKQIFPKYWLYVTFGSFRVTFRHVSMY